MSTYTGEKCDASIDLMSTLYLVVREKESGVGVGRERERRGGGGG